MRVMIQVIIKNMMRIRVPQSVSHGGKKRLIVGSTLLKAQLVIQVKWSVKISAQTMH